MSCALLASRSVIGLRIPHCNQYRIVKSFSHKSFDWPECKVIQQQILAAGFVPLLSRYLMFIYKTTLVKLYNARYIVIVLEGIDDASLYPYHISCSTSRDNLMFSPPARHIHHLRINTDKILPYALWEVLFTCIIFGKPTRINLIYCHTTQSGFKYPAPKRYKRTADELWTQPWRLPTSFLHQHKLAPN